MESTEDVVNNLINRDPGMLPGVQNSAGEEVSTQYHEQMPDGGHTEQHIEE